MYPYDEQQGVEFQQDVMDSYAEAGHALDLTNVVWSNRMTFDATAGSLGYQVSRDKHLAALRQQLGLVGPPPIPVVGLNANLIVNGHVFGLDNGARWTAVQCSDFNLLGLHQRGYDIRSILEQRAACGFNLLRVWTAFDIPGIGTFLDIDYGLVHQFVDVCAQHGLYVEFCAYTGINDPNHWTKLCEAAMRCRIRPLLELVNELDQNTNEPDFAGRVFDLSLHSQPAAPLLTSHGSNGSQAMPIEPYWNYATFHTNMAFEEQRKVGHNAMEIWGGPVLTNETSRYPDVGMWRGSDSERQGCLAFDSAAGAALLCAGSCYHSVSGKYSGLWSGDEEACAEMWADGAHSVDLNYQPGAYRRLDPGDYLRVYQRVLGDAFTVNIRK